MPNHELTLRKSTTQIRLYVILDRLLSYYRDKMLGYRNELQELSYPSEKDKENLKNVEEWLSKQWLLRNNEARWDDVEKYMWSPYEIKIKPQTRG